MRLKLQQQWLHTHIFNCLIKIIARDYLVVAGFDTDMSRASLLNSTPLEFRILFPLLDLKGYKSERWERKSVSGFRMCCIESSLWTLVWYSPQQTGRRRGCNHGITAHLYLHQCPSRRDQVSVKSYRSRSQPTDFTERCEVHRRVDGLVWEQSIWHEKHTGNTGK